MALVEVEVLAQRGADGVRVDILEPTVDELLQACGYICVKL